VNRIVVVVVAQITGFLCWNSVGQGGNFINVLHVHFLYKIFGAKISNPKASFVAFGAKILYEKSAHKMLMKLTQGFLFVVILFRVTVLQSVSRI